MRRLKGMMFLVAASVFLGASIVRADALSDAKARRKARRAEVVAILTAGKAEEGRDGYLVPKGKLTDQQAVTVKAENADRKIGYELIAKRNGKTVEEIGKHAAEIRKEKASRR